MPCLSPGWIISARGPRGRQLRTSTSCWASRAAGPTSSRPKAERGAGGGNVMTWISYSSLIPPSLFILVTCIGLALAWRWTRLGLVVATIGGALLYLASMPIVADNLIGFVRDLAPEMPILPSDAAPGAII